MREKTREELESLAQAIKEDPRSLALEEAEGKMLSDKEANELRTKLQEALDRNPDSPEAKALRKELLQNAAAREYALAYGEKQDLLREIDLILFGAYKGLKDA